MSEELEGEHDQDMEPGRQDYLEEPPPVLKSWRNLYLLVLGSLALWILFFCIFTWVFE